MKLKAWAVLNELALVKIGKDLGVAPNVVSMWFGGWKRVPEKYEQGLAEILKISIEEVRSGRVNRSRLDFDGGDAA